MNGSGNGRQVRYARWPGITAWALAVAVPLVFLAVFFAWPVATLVGKGFVTADGIDLGGFADVFSQQRTWRIIALTVVQAALGTLFSVGLGVPVAFVLYKLKYPGRTLARAFLTVTFVLPTVVVGVAFRSVFRDGGPLGFLGLDQSFPTIIAALVFFNLAVVARTVGGLWEHLDPRAEQAARTLGASPARVFWTVTWPSLLPAIGSAASVVFLYCSTAFGVVLVLGGRRFGTVETEIYRLTVQYLDLRSAAVLSTVQLVIVVTSLAVAARSRRRRENAMGLAPATRSARRPRVQDIPIIAVVTLALAVLHGLPLATLVARSLREPGGGWGLGNYRALGEPGMLGTTSATVWQAAMTSVRIAAVATLIAVGIGLLVALIVSRRPRAAAGRRAVAVFDAAFMLPLGVSAVTVGFGFLITLYQPFGLPVDLRTSGALIPIAQAVVAVPLVVRTTLPGLRAIDPRLRQAAASLGASPMRIIATIDAPIVARSAGLAIGFAMATSLGEFGATSFLVRPDVQTLPVVIFTLLSRQGRGYFEMALAASVVLAVLTATVMMIAERLRGDSTGEF